eukprot:CAMPEP_0185576760 /NCGR_PEP_ID=MMETSP0434-20130131/7620_1 /TAXON_ID=626734 ORGANISM="Favella taraikaensis, Strain Fe Narragansett Bay" /NCGR_SAMPLE_ID=MMETSP0434 /ASSEMBLY_ACC=CAM_ASM_000379 /LENGTH=69 /DNA_ID=CAMNT_0028194093 /DNA_START=268 /DNA_END=473 /DNA_ORIENTATION=-
MSSYWAPHTSLISRASPLSQRGMKLFDTQEVYAMFAFLSSTCSSERKLRKGPKNPSSPFTDHVLVLGAA